jgi:16S rRNA processing protein RimM
MSNYLRLGKLVATHGLKGELVLKHELRKKSSLKDLKTVFIEEKKNNFLPWFISSVRIKNEEETYIKLEGVEVREAATKLTQKNVWVTEEIFKKLAAKSSPVNLLGYTVINEKNSLGKILEVMEQPHQLLFKLEINNKEALIPMNENTLKKIDHKKKEVILELPEGLLDVYLT